jgi:hypothetical protein
MGASNFAAEEQDIISGGAVSIQIFVDTDTDRTVMIPARTVSPTLNCPRKKDY